MREHGLEPMSGTEFEFVEREPSLCDRAAPDRFAANSLISSLCVFGVGEALDTFDKTWGRGPLGAGAIGS